MGLHLKSEISADIDSAIWEIYGNRLGGGELAQLAKLFKAGGLPQRLTDILSPTLASSLPHYREELEIKLAWIDKRPLAKLKTETSRVELGDAAIFFFDIVKVGKRYLYNREARALVLQAKVAKEKRQIAQPLVPVNPGAPPASSSTARELALLSNWAQFDLYATSGSIEPIVRDISVAQAKRPPPNGWYMATPKIQPDAPDAAAWTSPWMCAPSASGSPCTVTLGSLLWHFLTASAFANSKVPLPEAGVNFKFDPQYFASPRGNGWDRLCVEILRLCPKNNLPQSLFGGSTRSAVVTSVVRSLPYLGGDNWLGDFFRWLRELIAPHGMPILLITVLRIE
jgi:hypothetical protein